MPVPAKKKVKHYRGDDFRYSFRLDQYIDPNDPDQGTQPVDLAGYTATIESDPDVPFVASAPDNTGVVTVDLPAESTTDPEVGVIEFDIQLTTPAPDSFRRTFVHVVMTLVEQVA